MARDDESYYRRRAEEEIERAQQSNDPNVVRSHYLLAELYLDQIYGGGETPPS